jgi:ribokinase
MNKIFVVGSMNMDLIIKADRIPDLGETLQGTNFCMLPGGKGANQAVACSILGGTPYMIGSIGDDIFGKLIEDDLKEKGVNIDHIEKFQDMASGVACILINNSDNRIILDQGANKKTSYHHVESVLSTLAKQSDILLTQLEIPVETVFESLVLAKELGLMTILNPAPAKELPDTIYQYVDIIIPNEIEAEMITGIDCSDEKFNQKVVSFFIDKGVREVLITRGKKGSIYGSEKRMKICPSYEVDVIDTTGAGDAYVGAIASRVAMGFSVTESLKFATASSALAVTKLGALKSLPTIEEVNNFLKRKQG